LLSCPLNCYGDASTPVPLPGGNGNGVQADTIEACREFCFATEGCEGIIFGEKEKMCWGKKDIRTSKCQLGDGYTTELLTEMPFGTCTLMGDPHVLTFDGAKPSFYGDGDFWVIRSKTVFVQARFEGTRYTMGLAASNRVLVGGPFLHGHKIEVGTRESGVLTVDGQPVCGGFPSSYTGAGFSLTYDGQGEVPDVVPEGNEKRVVHMDLPDGVHVTVFQWNNYVDLRITMAPQPNQDGVCGNFNGEHLDDTTKTIFERIGARVSPAENMLSGKAFVEFTPAMQRMMQNECSARDRSWGQQVCAKSLRSGFEAIEVQACTFDMCFGYNDHARLVAKKYS